MPTYELTGLGGYIDPYTLICHMRQTEMVHAQMNAMLVHQLSRFAAFTPASSPISVAIPVSGHPTAVTVPAKEPGELYCCRRGARE